jgi:hypothetical protein
VPILTKQVKDRMNQASGPLPLQTALRLGVSAYLDPAAKDSVKAALADVAGARMKGGIKLLHRIILERLSDLRELYADARRFETGGNADTYLRFFGNYLVRLEALAASPLARLYEATTEFDADMAIGQYGLTPEEAVEEIERGFAVREAARLEDEKRQAAREEEETVRGNLLDTNNAAKALARQSVPHFAGDKRIDNMVCEVRDLRTGASATGRAGQKESHQTLEKLLSAKCGVTVRISTSPANTAVTGNTVNCAEWDALYKLLQHHTPATLRGSGSTYSDLYFAAAVPGKRGGLIPPCDNCKRLMNFLFAKAYGYTPARRADSVAS